MAGRRFDFTNFGPADAIPIRDTLDESGALSTLQRIGNCRATAGMSGSGFIEILAEKMTMDRQAVRDSLAPGEALALALVDGGWIHSEPKPFNPDVNL